MTEGALGRTAQSGAGEAPPVELVLAPSMRQSGLPLLAKRVFDLTVAAVGLVVLSPLLLLVAIAVRLDSEGPALFRQERVGKGGRTFTFYKFRTMRTDASADAHRAYVTALIKEETEDLRGDNGSYKLEGDSRITKLGRVLRRTSIDELPQLVNVVRGEMSLVGPRPPIGYEVELYGPRERRRLDVIPGITGLWQVSGRCKTTYQQMVDLDLHYIESWSFLLDMRILVRTARVVLGREGAW